MFGYEPEYIDCGDARIACYDIGRGHPLILLHGNGEDSSYWNAQISAGISDGSRTMVDFCLGMPGQKSEYRSRICHFLLR